MRWSLDELYSSLESEAYQKDFDRFCSLVEETHSWSLEAFSSDGDSVQKLEDFIKRTQDVQSLATRLVGFPRLIMSINARNGQAPKAMAQVTQKMSTLTEARLSMNRWLIKHKDKVEQFIANSELLQDHSLLIERIIEDSKHLLTDAEEVLLSKLWPTGANAWTEMQQALAAMHTAELDGERLPITVVRDKMSSADGDLRKRAFAAEQSSYPTIERPVAEALNAVKGEVITLTKHRGYSSPLESALEHWLMDEETLRAVWSAVESSLPTFRKFYERKGKLLGNADGLPIYDLPAPIGSCDRRMELGEARTYIVDHFREFSDKLADFSDKAFEQRWLDTEPREGKMGGGFCAPIHAIGQSRILTNYTGAFSELFVLAHELGHAYHFECLKDESILNSMCPMPVAETASVFCETIVYNAALATATGDELLYLLEQHIRSQLSVIADVYSRFLFEDEVFRLREQNPLSVEDIKGIMEKSQKRVYGDVLTVTNPYAWVTKPHYYLGTESYYNFSYCFGDLFTKGLYAEYKRRGKDFVTDYDKLLASSAKLRVIPLAASIDIDLHDETFWRRSLSLLEEEIERFIELTQ